MPDHPDVAQVVDRLEDHPAVVAWSTLAAGPSPSEVRVLKERAKGITKSAVYWLKDAAPNGGPVIAKLAKRDVVAVESYVYREVLAHTSVEAPHFYGTVEDGGAWTWMFVEHIAGERYTPHRADHRRAAAKWVADLHVAAMESASPPRLPDRGPGHLREWVRRGRDAMTAVAGYPAATRDELRTAEALRSTLDALDSEWSEVTRAAGQLPRTLVHGDLVRKNLVVRGDRGVVAFDWEKAGWGSPALDLAYGDGGDVSKRFAASPCLDTYRSVLSVHGLEVERDVIAQCAAIGTALRCVFGIGWSAVSLNDRWVHHPMAYMTAYAPVLQRAMTAAGIGGRDARN